MTFHVNKRSPVKPNIEASPSLAVPDQDFYSNDQRKGSSPSASAGFKWHRLLIKEYENILFDSAPSSPLSKQSVQPVLLMNKINNFKFKNFESILETLQIEPVVVTRVKNQQCDPVITASLGKIPAQSVAAGSLKTLLERLKSEAHLTMCGFVLENFNDSILGKALEFLESKTSSSKSKISYREFRKFKKDLTEHLKSSIFERHFQPKRFLLYPRPEKALVDSSLIEQYLVSQVSIARIYAEMASFDRGGKQYLTRNEMADYLISTLSSVESIQQFESDIQRSVYVPFVVAKFSYQLDPFCKGKLYTLDLMKSRYLTLYGQLRDGGLSGPEINLNPFCIDKAIDLYDYFEDMKKESTSAAMNEESRDDRTSLCRAELDEIGDRQWNRVFLDAIFAYHYSARKSDANGIFLKSGMFLEDFFYFHLVVRDLETRASIYFVFRAIANDFGGKIDEDALLYYLKGNSNSNSNSNPNGSRKKGASITDMQQVRSLAWEIFRALDKDRKGHLRLSDCLARPKLTVQLFELILFQPQGTTTGSEIFDTLPSSSSSS